MWDGVCFSCSAETLPADTASTANLTYCSFNSASIIINLISAQVKEYFWKTQQNLWSQQRSDTIQWYPLSHNHWSVSITSAFKSTCPVVFFLLYKGWDYMSYYANLCIKKWESHPCADCWAEVAGCWIPHPQTAASCCSLLHWTFHEMKFCALKGPPCQPIADRLTPHGHQSRFCC